MKREDIIRMAREADPWGPDGRLYAMAELTPEVLERFAAIATERERAARQAAQVENESLKARLARAGMEQRKAVLEEREAILSKQTKAHAVDGHCAIVLVADIRARGTP